jgi:mono/diheme cytochrome c family protein
MAKWRDPLTPLEQELRRRALTKLWIAMAATVAVLLFVFYVGWSYSFDRPVAYSDPVEHFKYGSIGSDIENGLPVRVLNVLPRMFPQYMPPGPIQDYTAFGFIQEPGRPLPIGFSIRRKLIDLAGLNCASCHVGQVRKSVQDPPVIILGMPADTLDLQAFLDFLMSCAADERFTTENILAAMSQEGGINWIDRAIYYVVIPRLQAGLLKLRVMFDSYMLPDHPRFGPGRVDTFNPYKANQLSGSFPRGSLAREERIGTADFPAVWRQNIRDGMNLHWDGNNSSVRERNFSAAFGAGATRENVDGSSFDRVTRWLEELPAPKYPFGISSDPAVLARGEAIYRDKCFACHDVKGASVGLVEPLEVIGTDRHRLDSYTEKLAQAQLRYGEGYPWQFKAFRKTNGYANQPLDGIWARAPYLHNGSVPTLWDLLTPQEERNEGNDDFYSGSGVYDPDKVGIRTDVLEVDGRKSFRFVISQPGNGNMGHSGQRFGTTLSLEEKRALIEFMKTF